MMAFAQKRFSEVESSYLDQVKLWTRVHTIEIASHGGHPNICWRLERTTHHVMALRQGSEPSHCFPLWSHTNTMDLKQNMVSHVNVCTNILYQTVFNSNVCLCWIMNLTSWTKVCDLAYMLYCACKPVNQQGVQKVNPNYFKHFEGQPAESVLLWFKTFSTCYPHQDRLEVCNLVTITFTLWTVQKRTM